MTRADDIHKRRWAILGVLCLSLFVIVMDNTIVNVALPSLVRELGATTSQLQWIVDSYTLVFAGLLLSFGALGDRFGRKGALLGGMAVFGAASLVAAVSSSAGELIASRAVMGLGAALIMPATLSILTNVFTVPKERAVAIALWSAISGAAIALGPVTGGFLLDHFSWGSVFMVNVPIVIGAVIAGWAIVPTSRDPAAPKIDVGGALLSIVGLVGLVYTIIEAPHHGWTSTQTIAGFAGSLAVLALFIVHELRTSEPMLDIRFFENARFTAASISVTLVSFALFGFIFMATQYLQFVLGYSPLSAGVHTIPFAVAVMVMAPRSAKIVERFGTKRVVATGMLLFALGLLVASTSTVTSGYGIVFVAIVLMGSGMGLTIAPATESIMGSLPKEKAGVGSAVNDTTREIGGALGVAVIGSVLASVYSSHLTDAASGRLPQPALDTATSSVGAALAVAQRIGPAAEPLVSAARQAFVDGMVIGSRLTAVVAVIGALVALKWLPARATDEITDDVDVELEVGLQPVETLELVAAD
ncbi:MAG TPA: DHA2 family efflux MFS transporter permease subunit [Acidimicrobiales bacterium]|nr:DHA2 family efflux MFS transporter permease subunit [Acidimicrobiales bacterium]